MSPGACIEVYPYGTKVTQPWQQTCLVLTDLLQGLIGETHPMVSHLSREVFYRTSDGTAPDNYDSHNIMIMLKELDTMLSTLKAFAVITASHKLAEVKQAKKLFKQLSKEIYKT